MPLIAGERTDVVGGYTLVRPVVVGVRESIWSARDRSGDACTLEICERFDDSPESGEALGDFIERATLLNRIASASGDGAGLGLGHVAPVRDLRATEFGAVFAREEYGLTGREIVSGKVRLRGDALQEIVAGVLTSLTLFDEHAGRPHGALRPDVVLIEGTRAGQLRVGLRSPATRADLSVQADTAGAEMRRLGLLIFEFVLHRPFREMGGYPVRDGPEWRALGPHADIWLGLVNELLDPAGPRLTLAEARERVAALPFRVDGPGAGVWLGRAGIAAAVLAVVGAGIWFGFRPGVEPIRAKFEGDRFEQWLRLTPVVASLRDGVAALDDPPPVLTDALARLSLTDEERERMKLDDPFDIEAAFRTAELYRSFERTIDNPLPDLLDGVGEFVAAEIEARAGVEEKTADQLRLETLAGVFERGLTLFDGNGGGNGLVDALSSDEWAARGIVSGLSDADELAWLDPSAAGLFDEVSSRVDGAIETFRGGARGNSFATATAQDALAGGRLPVVDDFLDAALEIEAAAALVGEWTGLQRGVAANSDAVVASSGWPALPEPVRSRLAGSADPFLASLAELPRLVGVVAEGEGVSELNERLRAAERMSREVRGWVDENWSGDGVDLIAFSEWTDSVRPRVEATPPVGSPSELAAWVDARIELGGEWIRAAQSAPVIEEADWTVSAMDLDDGLVVYRERWREAFESAPDETAEAEIRIAGGAGVLEAGLDEIERRLEALRSVPRWPSLEDGVNAERNDLEKTYQLTGTLVNTVYNEVLMPPRTLIADWRDLPVVSPSRFSDALRGARSAIGEREIESWEAWAGDRDDDTLKREPETDALRTALRGINEAIREAEDRIVATLGEDRGYGGFDRSAVDSALAPVVAALVLAELEAIDAWGEKASYDAGGVVSTRLTRTEEAVGARLDEADAALTVVSRASRGIARGMVAGEIGGALAVADPEALRAATRGLREGPFATLLDIRAVADAVSAVDGLSEIERIDDPARLLTLFAAEAESPGRSGIAVAAIGRLDGLARDGGVWPASAVVLEDERADLLAGASALRGHLPEADWDRVSPELQSIVRDWWRRGVARAGDRSAFVTATDGVGGWFDGIDAAWDGLLGEELLEGRNKYNAGVVRLRSAIGATARAAMAEAENADRDSIPAIDRRLLDAVTARLEEVEALSSETLGDDSMRDSAISWVRSFREGLNEARQGRRGWDADDFGPVGAGFNGWRAELDEDAEPPSVRYIKEGGPTVEFRLLEELRDGGQVFLSVDEVSVEICDEILRIAGNDFRNINQLETWFDPSNGVPGPTARRLLKRGRRFRALSQPRWLRGQSGEYGPVDPKHSYPAYPPELRGDAPDQISASQGSPNERHPMNWVPERLAEEMAERFGCRLPTVTEFSAALSFVPPADAGRWNLRDGTILAQRANARAARTEAEITHYWPGDWSYDDTRGSTDEVWRINGPGTDDRLWFSTTGPGLEGAGDPLFRHLIGNVAEYVLASDAADARLMIMGASALSEPGVAPGDARPTDVQNKSPNGFVDVGFRLAIDADDFGSLGKMVLKKIDETENASFVAGR